MNQPILYAGLAALGLGVLAPAAPRTPITEGSLYSIDREGRPLFCPLKHTDVQANISGFLARVTVTQEFVNPSSNKIEAVYKFPLPHDAAVDSMEMRIGPRTIKGDIKRREDARRIYDQARQRGQTASLLDQERPNIFTQSVANIPPGASVKVVISYVETLQYEEGSYEFVFPMVVGPRYSPKDLADAPAITPKRTPEGTRAGHDIHVKVTLDAGLPLQSIRSSSHPVDIMQADPRRALVLLKNEATIPNKDFVLRYQTAGEKLGDALLFHRDTRGGFFTLILQPPQRVTPAEVTPKEIVFVVDTSGSMHGFPLEKAKQVIRGAFDGLHPRDTFNLITFSGDDHVLFPAPVPANSENIAKAWEFLRSRQGSGGTEMMKAIRSALAPSQSQEHVRIVCFVTDGEVGNDNEILAEIQRYSNARVFAMGIGSSVNRYLLDGMAKYGRGEVEYVLLGQTEQADATAAAQRFHQRVRTPLLTDVWVDWHQAPVQELYPQRIPDVFAAKPVVISGRYSTPGERTITLHGKVAGKPWSRQVKLALPAKADEHDSLATLWARRKIADLANTRQHDPETKETITKLGLDFRLMTQYTSFVAVDDSAPATEGGLPTRIDVPVEMPEGVSYRAYAVNAAAPLPVSAAPKRMVMPREERLADADSSRKLDPALNPHATGTVKVQLWLTAAPSPALLAKLQKLGFKVTAHPGGALLIGEVAANQLLTLALLPEVKLIQPAK